MLLSGEYQQWCVWEGDCDVDIVKNDPQVLGPLLRWPAATQWQVSWMTASPMITAHSNSTVHIIQYNNNNNDWQRQLNCRSLHPPFSLKVFNILWLRRVRCRYKLLMKLNFRYCDHLTETCMLQPLTSWVGRRGNLLLDITTKYQRKCHVSRDWRNYCRWK